MVVDKLFVNESLLGETPKVNDAGTEAETTTWSLLIIWMESVVALSLPAVMTAVVEVAVVGLEVMAPLITPQYEVEADKVPMPLMVNRPVPVLPVIDDGEPGRLLLAPVICWQVCVPKEVA